MELNAEQIKYALGCCVDGDCYPCPYAEIGAGCRDRMAENALSLIKELTEEYESMAKSVNEASELIRKLRAEKKELIEERNKVSEKGAEILTRLEEAYLKLESEKIRLTEENERLRAELTGANKDKQILFDEIASLEAEAEKAIDIAEGNIRAEIASGGTSCHWCEDKVKADTVRKYREGLHKELASLGSKDKFNKGVFLTKADQIAKEMVEGEK